jgi:dihydroxyacetone kinase-like predicted kinase
VCAARESVARTPSLLPVLRENGVVDAGAEGFLRILEGAARASAGVANPALSGTLDTVPGEPDAASPPISAATGSGLFCTSLFLEGSDLPLARIRERLASEGTSLIVAGDSRSLRIHIHTARPDEVVAWARSLGAVSNVDRHELPPAGAAGRGTVAAATRPALLAIAPGEGIGDVFEGLGASRLVPRAASGLPTVAELREVLALLPGSGVILLPNSPAGLEIARKAVVSFGKPVTIIPTRTVPEGTAAIVSFRYDLPMKENALLMERAARSVRTIELSEARGRVEARLDGISTGACDDPRKAVTDALRRLGMTNPETVTVYTGASVAPSLVESVCGVLRRAMPEAALETVPGGQAQPGLIIGVE